MNGKMFNTRKFNDYLKHKIIICIDYKYLALQHLMILFDAYYQLKRV